MNEFKDMKFDALHIERDKWGINKGRITGKITFHGNGAEISVLLTETQANKLISVVAEAAAETAREIAKVTAVAFGLALPAPGDQVIEGKVEG